MPYMVSDAIFEVCGSTDWRSGLPPSIKKWEQIVSGDQDSYPRAVGCGFCIVQNNRDSEDERGCLLSCPAHDICISAINDADSEEVLKGLRDLEQRMGEEEYDGVY